MTPLFGKGGQSDREREQRQRSGDEREQARRDREERRAAREGRDPVELPPLPPDLDPPPAPVEPPPMPEARPTSEPEPEPAPDLAPAWEPEPPGHVEPEAEPEPDPAWDPEPAALAEPATEPAPDPAPAWEPEPAPEPLSVPEPTPAAELAPDPPPVAPPEPAVPAPYFARPAHMARAAPAEEPDDRSPVSPLSDADLEHPAPPGDEPAEDPGSVRLGAAQPAFAWPDEDVPLQEPEAAEPLAGPSPAEPSGPQWSAPMPTRGVSKRDARRQRRATADPVDPELADLDARSDAPVGVKRVAASSMASAAGASSLPRFGAPPRGVPRRRRGRRALPIAFLLLVAAVAVFAYRLYQPGADGGKGAVTVTIPQGNSAGQIGDLLASQDVVPSSFFFSLRARMDGGSLRSGKVELKQGMSYAAALAELTKPAVAAPKLAKIVLPEGPSSKELAGRVKDAGFTGSYTAAAKRSPRLDPRDYGAPKAATLEGFLFPATYELKPGSSAKALVSEQLKAFKRAFAKLDMKKARARNLSRYDVLVIASMIEREAGVAKDRRLISGVIYNRLKQGIPLGIDATIRYDLENFSRPLRVSELEKDTPYNTRTRTGLPPGPIGNPGLASLQAAANPASNDFVFYVVKPCADGAHAFSSTDAQFQQDVAKYNKKRDELGGKDPSQC